MNELYGPGPTLLHLEITSRCPLDCPQCYTRLAARDMDPDLLNQIIHQAAEAGVKVIALSGGEPLAYLHLTSLIWKIKRVGMLSIMATSGFGLTPERLSELKEAGLEYLFLSLNGSNAAIHNLSRDRFDASFEALQVLKDGLVPYGLNWVARHDNIADFPAIYELAKKHGVKSISVLKLKPDRKHELAASPTLEGLYLLAGFLLERSKGDIQLNVESCYPELQLMTRELVGKSQMIGCAAGRIVMAVSLQGQFLPCRHLEHPAMGMTLGEYWEHDPVLKQLRNIDSLVGDPCQSCSSFPDCRTCRASCEKLYDDLLAGNQDCPFKAQGGLSCV